jgi:hypothetical protein
MNDSVIEFSHTYATPFLLIGISVLCCATLVTNDRNACAKSVLMTEKYVLHLSLMTGMPVRICSYDSNVSATPVTNDRIACAHLFL